MPRRALLGLLSLAVLGCASFPRRLEYATVRSPALRNTWNEYGIYLPPDLGAEETLPLVVFLHGGGDGADCLDRHGVAQRLDRGMRDGTVPRAIIVVPQGDLGFWANWYDGSRRYEDWVIDEVMPAVARRFRTQPCPEGCHIMGVSMGAEGAVRMALHHPGMFASLSPISGPAMDTERRLGFMRDPLINIIIPTHHVFGPIEPRSRVEVDDPYVQWSAPEDLHGTRLFFAWGSRDRDMIREGGAALHQHLEERGIPHVSREYDGGHDWVSWGPVIEEALRAQLGPESAPSGD